MCLRIINAMFGRGLGGIEQAFLDYSDMLSSGFEVVNVARRHSEITRINKPDNLHTFNASGWADFITPLKLIKLIKQENAKAVVCHGSRAFMHFMRAKQIGGLNIFVIAVAHNYSIAKFVKADAVLCITKDLCQKAKDIGISEHKIHHIPNAVNCDNYSTLKTQNSPLVIGSLGRFVAKKGFDVFIEAVAMLKQEGMVFKVLLAGNGEETANLKALANEKNVSDIITFTGWVYDKNTFFRDIDIFCLPSLHEPFGIVLLEAMAAGLPIVSTDSEGPREILSASKDCFMVEKGNPWAMSTALGALLRDDGSIRNSFTRAATEKVRNHYDIKVVSEKLSTIIKSHVE